MFMPGRIEVKATRLCRQEIKDQVVHANNVDTAHQHVANMPKLAHHSVPFIVHRWLASHKPCLDYHQSRYMREQSIGS